MNPAIPSPVFLQRLLPIALLLLLADGTGADIIPSGRKSVPSELFIEGTERFPDKIFVLYPARFGVVDGKSVMVAEKVTKGKSIRFYHLLSPKLYALKAGTDLTDTTVFEDPAVPRSSVTIRQVGFVPLSERAKRIRRVYRITKITGKEMVLKQEPDQRFDGAGKPLDQKPSTPPADKKANNDPVKAGIWPMVGVVGLPLLLGFLVIRGERRGKAASTVDSEGSPRS